MEEQQWHRLVAALEILIEDTSLNAVKAALLTIETMQPRPAKD